MKNNAILLCGGIGRRMAPIPTCNKALLPIKGEINLKRIIRILKNKNIKDIVVATNPLFASDINSLLSKWDEFSDMNIRIVCAYDYVKGCNNVVTMKAASKYIENTYILECDQYYIEENLRFLSEIPHSSSLLFTQPRDEEDWGVVSDRFGHVHEILRDNPNRENFCLSGITYFTGDSSKFLRVALDSCRDSSIYWEELLDPMIQYIEEYRCYKPYAKEYDTISDLINENLMSPEEVASLIDDNSNPVRLGSMTNTTYKVTYEGKEYALRIPGYGTDRFVNHHRERAVESTIPEYLKPQSQYYSNDSVKLTDYLEGYQVFKDIEDIKYVLEKLHDIHLLSEVQQCPYTIDLMKEVEDYEDIYGALLLPYSGDTRKYEKMKSQVSQFLDFWFHNYPHDRVHRDLVPLNIMLNEEKDVKFIDWEYAGYLSFYWDLASLCCEYADEYNVPLDSIVDKVMEYYPGPLNRNFLYCWIVVVDFVWAVWSLAKKALGDDVYEYGERRYARSSLLMEEYMEDLLK